MMNDGTIEGSDEYFEFLFKGGELKMLALTHAMDDELITDKEELEAKADLYHEGED